MSASASAFLPARRVRAAAYLLLPFLLLFVFCYVAPIGYAVYQSFFEIHRSGLGFGAPSTVFSGLANYTRALGDPSFRSSLTRVALIGVVQVPLMLGLALLLALLLDAKAAPLKRFFRLAYFLPYALPGVTAGLMWSFLYGQGISPISAALSHLGLNIDLTSDSLLPWAVGNIITWAWTGYNMVIIYSNLQAIPQELYEAAALDGCSAWRLAWHVKIPLVRPALVLTAVFSIIGTAQLYNEPVILQHVAPNLGNNWTPIMAATNSVAGGDYHYAAAQSVILALVIFVLSFGFLKLVQRRGETQ